MAQSEKNKGAWMIGFSILCALLGLGFIGYGAYYWHKHNTLRNEGLVVTAQVSDKRSETQSSRRSRSTSYQVIVAFPSKHGKPFRDEQASKAEAKPAPKTGVELVNRIFENIGVRTLVAPPDTKARLAQMSDERYAKLNLGGTVPVVFLASDTSYVIEAQTLREDSSWPPLLSGLAFVILGGGLMYWGIKKRAKSN